VNDLLAGEKNGPKYGMRLSIAATNAEKKATE